MGGDFTAQTTSRQLGNEWRDETYGSVQPTTLVPPPPPPTSAARSTRGRRSFVAAVVVVVGLLSGTTGALVTHQLDHGEAQSSSTSTLPTGIAASTSAPASTSSGSSTFAGVPLSVADVIAKVEPAVVTIQVSITQGRLTGTAAGTGIILTADGRVLTNAHVVSGATSITVGVAGQSQPMPATLIGADTVNDIALIKVTGASGLPTVTTASGAARVGDEVIAIGNALALNGELTVTKGIVSALNRSVDTGTSTMTGMLQTDAAISSGNSGGPLVNAAGQVIGINTMIATSTRGATAENIGFTIPIDHALTVANALLAANPGVK